MSSRPVRLVRRSPRGKPASVAQESTRSDARDAVLLWLTRIQPYLLLFLGFRMLVAVVAVFASWLAPTLSSGEVLAKGWDGGWYLSIAENGYPPDLSNAGGGNAWAFFPGYPGALRGTATLLGTSMPTASIFVGLLFGILAAVGVGLALEDLVPRPAAIAGTAAFLFFPTSFVLAMSYTEAPFVACSAFMLLLLRRQLWLPAAAMAAYGSVLRPQGAVLVATFVIAAFIMRGPVDVRRVVAVLLTPAPLLGWLWYQFDQLGTPIGFLEAQAAWGAGDFAWFSTPFRAVGHVVRDGVGLANAHQVLATIGLVFMLSGTAALIIIQRRGAAVPVHVWVFVLGTIFAAASPFFASSVLRYSSVAFPLLGALVAITPSRLRWPVIAGSAMWQGALTVVALASFSLTATTTGTAPFAP
jgi:hypothetical protein